MAKLTQALASKDTEGVRETAAHLVSTVRDAIQKRRVREAQQLELLSERLSSLRGELTQAKADAQTDALTKLSNRAAFDEHIARLSDLGLLFSHPPCLLMLDLDHFKAINDECGHPAGDAVLVEVGKCLTRTFLRKQDFVGRYGGEEFAALIVDTPLEQAKMLADRACNNLRETPVLHQGREIEVTMSVGIAALIPGEGVDVWIRRADGALYAAKSAGRDRAVVAGEVAVASAPGRALPAKGRTGSSGAHRAAR
jgi:diguanylate cyclase